MIEAIGLSKLYGKFAATREVTFSVPCGQVAAFLGPNGAGKSTTMKMLTGYLAPTAGSSRIAGFDVSTHRLESNARLGYLPENGPLYSDMTPLGHLRFFGEARGLSGAKLRERIDSVVAQTSLGEVIEKPVSKLSKGFRQRLGMAQALLHDPQVIIMDDGLQNYTLVKDLSVLAIDAEFGLGNGLMMPSGPMKNCILVAGVR